MGLAIALTAATVMLLALAVSGLAVRTPALVGPVTLLPTGGGETLETTTDPHGRFKLEPPAGVYDMLIELDHGQRAILAPGLEVGPG